MCGVAKFLNYMGGKSGPGSVIHVTEDLGNESHYDGDLTMSVGFWTEDDPGTAENWYFLLPNVQIRDSTGVAIQLKHGRVIEWCGYLLRHCSTVPSPKAYVDVDGNSVANHVHGYMVGCTGPKCSSVL